MTKRTRTAPAVIAAVYPSDDEWEVDTEQFAPPAQGPNYHFPDEIHGLPDLPPDEDSDPEDNRHIGLWREGDLGALVLALNYYHDELKGKFIGASGGKERKRKAWQKVKGEYIFFHFLKIIY